MLSAFVAHPLASQSSPAQDDVIEKILCCRGEWPSGLRAVALRLRDQPSSATTLRAVPALSGRSSLARSRLTPRGNVTARRVGHRDNWRFFQSRGAGFRRGIQRMKIRVRRRGVPGLARRDAERRGCVDGVTLSSFVSGPNSPSEAHPDLDPERDISYPREAGGAWPKTL